MCPLPRRRENGPAVLLLDNHSTLHAAYGPLCNGPATRPHGPIHLLISPAVLLLDNLPICQVHEVLSSLGVPNQKHAPT